jgi:mono/diheme cytochrome c family protein
MICGMAWLTSRTSIHRPSPVARAVRALVVLFVIGVCASGFVKGTGIKTRIWNHFFPRPARTVVEVWSVAEGQADPSIRFEKVQLPQASGAAFTCVQIGPDHRLYAGADDGRIFRLPINSDGTVGDAQVITSLQSAEGGKRLLTGFCFDPASTPQEPIVWACHGFHGFKDVPDFTGRVSRLRGPNLEIVEDVIVGLPRSVRDHLTNQPVFGPDGALYFPQGSNTASGAPDADWGNRPEHLLNAAVLRLDVTKVTPGKPLDARTQDVGGAYEPGAPGAPLTIYATGLRNAYDLLWTSDGHLYVPVNGSSCGGSAPAGPGVPAIVNLVCSEDDWLFDVKPRKYYGHPNPAQRHFVLNGGNPGNRHDASVISQYPLGTKPDPDWQPAVFDFGPHVSADGIIEYRGNAFGGKLDRKLLVCRFNVGADLICLGLGADGKVHSVQTKIPGASGFANPLDLTEDLQSGNLYVAEYGGKCITLLRPMSANVPLLVQDNTLQPLSSRAANGKRLYETTCIACHGPVGQGIPNLGPSLRDSRFVATHSDDALIAFIKQGRLPGDPQSVMKLIMPPKGGNPALEDGGIADILSFIRALQETAAARTSTYRPSVGAVD